ncbi:MAG: hypothetical protein OIF55_05915 [Amphritea sp.]|nr:hypothetical protein [Amphritea sp.]
MFFLIRNGNTDQPLPPERFDTIDALQQAEQSADDLQIPDCDTLLRQYVATELNTPLYGQLQLIRDQVLEDLDEVDSAAEIHGLIHWLLNDHGINAAGASLEETADRLSDIDIEQDSDQYTDIIFHLKDAIDRLYELELDDY